MINCNWFLLVIRILDWPVRSVPFNVSLVLLAKGQEETIKELVGLFSLTLAHFVLLLGTVFPLFLFVLLSVPLSVFRLKGGQGFLAQNVAGVGSKLEVGQF